MSQESPVTCCRFPSVEIGGHHIRFIYFREPNLFYVTKRERATDIPLFLGADVLAGSSVSSNNHSRVHDRYFKQNLCTSIYIKGARIEGINHSNKLWFYNVQGLFKIAFEYLSKETQKDCLLLMRDLWVDTAEYKLLGKMDVMPELSSVAEEESESPFDIISLNGYMDTPPQISGVNTLKTPRPKVNRPIAEVKQKTTVNKSSLSQDLNVQVTSVNNQGGMVTTRRDVESGVIEEVIHSDTNAIYLSDEATIYIEQPAQNYTDPNHIGNLVLTTHSQGEPDDSKVCSHNRKSYVGVCECIENMDGFMDFVVNFIHSQKENLRFSKDDDELYSKLLTLLQFFQLEIMRNSTEDPGFPFDIIEEYTNMLSEEMVLEVKHDSYHTPVRNNIFLCIASRWLGKVFHEFSSPITTKVEEFKLRNIDQINNLPSSQSLVRELFPTCMVVLLMNWMGNDYNETILLTPTLEEDSSHHHVPSTPACKKRKQDKFATIGSENKNEKQKQNSFPFVQLILEFVNNVLISGVAHVLYSRLLQNESC